MSRSVEGGLRRAVALNEGYGLPLPVLLSDLPVDGSATEVTEAALQDAVAHNGYVIVQATNPVIIYNGIKIPSGHFLEGALCPTMVTLKAALFNLSDNQESVRIDNFVIDGRGMTIRGAHGGTSIN